MRILRLHAAAVVLCTAVLLPATAEAQSAWTREVASEPKAGEVRQLLFDHAGHGVALWAGADMARPVNPLSALSLRAPGAGWRRGPDLTGIRFARPGLFTYGRDRLLLVQALERLAAPEAKPTFGVAFGSAADGTFEPLRELNSRAYPIAADVNTAGDAVVVLLTHGGALRVVERTAGHAFSRPRALLPRGAGPGATAALNGRGDRLVAWHRKGAMEARVGRAGRRWGKVKRIGRAPLADRITGRISADRRVLVTWGGMTAFEGHPARADLRLAVRSRRDAGWKSRRLESITSRAGSAGTGVVLPAFDSRGLAWVAWSGHATGRPVVKVARVSGTHVQPAVTISGPDSYFSDFAAGPDGRLGVTWNGVGAAVPGQPRLSLPFARLRSAGGTWGPSEPLAGVDQSAFGALPIAFDPVGGRASVAWLRVVGKQGQLLVSTEGP